MCVMVVISTPVPYTATYDVICNVRFSNVALQYEYEFISDDIN